MSAPHSWCGSLTLTAAFYHDRASLLVCCSIAVVIRERTSPSKCHWLVVFRVASWSWSVLVVHVLFNRFIKLSVCYISVGGLIDRMPFPIHCWSSLIVFDMLVIYLCKHWASPSCCYDRIVLHRRCNLLMVMIVFLCDSWVCHDERASPNGSVARSVVRLYIQWVIVLDGKLILMSGDFLCLSSCPQI